MLVKFILYLLYGALNVITFPLRVFDDVANPGFITDAVSSAVDYISFGYSILPLAVSALLLTWGAFLAFEAGIFAYKGLIWIIKKIPGIG